MTHGPHTILLLLIMSSAISAARAVRVNRLRCEYRSNPRGIDVDQPRLSWVLESDRRGEVQTAYQILVASSPENLSSDIGDLWDSGRVESDTNIHVAYAGPALRSRDQCFWKVRAWDATRDPTPWSAPSFWTMGLLHPADWHSRWIGVNPHDAGGQVKPPIPGYLRKEFALLGPVRRATVYVTALGLYELTLNGRRVGHQLLAPEWTSYGKRVQYQTFDVAALLTPGGNAIGAVLGNGWYCGNWQHWKGELEPIHDDTPHFLLQLEIEYADGRREEVLSDDTWRGCGEGPLRFSGIYEGETYDARLEMPGWDCPGFDERTWTRATVRTPESRAIVWQRSEPIEFQMEIPPVRLTEPKPGTYVFDLGQNLAGWAKLQIDEPRGTTLVLKFNETLNPDGTVYMDNLHAGHLSTGDRQVIRYTCRGGGEQYQPHFTYQGFRYVQVEGLSKRPEANAVTGCVFHTGFERTGSFVCSSPLLNRLFSNIQWSQRANMMGVPTDCCQRDERCGYTGDMNFFIPTAVYNFDMGAFCSKWLVDLCQDSQMPGGWFADHAPYYGPGPGPNVGWADAGIICPYVVWQTYGDTRVIRDHYPAMQKMLGWIRSNATDLCHVENVGNGDWLNLGGGASKEVIGTAYDAYDFRLMGEMASAIGRAQEAEAYRTHADAIGAAFAKRYIAPDGRIKDSGQTGYALAFTMGLVPAEMAERVSGQFAAEIDRFDRHLATGFIGTARLLPGLHLAGRDDLAHALLMKETYPSWLFQVKNGATTLWERWNGWTPEGGYADSGMNSFNHYAFGAVGEYLYSVIGGIRALSPGFKTIQIKPVPGPGIDWAKTGYQSIHGLIESDWHREGPGFLLKIRVPANTSAVVYVPTGRTGSMTEGGKPAADANGVSFIRNEPGYQIFHVGSGSYAFESS